MNTVQTTPAPQKPLTIGEIVTRARYKPARIAVLGRLIFVYVPTPAGLNQPTLHNRFKHTPLDCVQFGWTATEGHYFALQLKPGVHVS